MLSPVGKGFTLTVNGHRLPSGRSSPGVGGPSMSEMAIFRQLILAGRFGLVERYTHRAQLVLFVDFQKSDVEMFLGVEHASEDTYQLG
jgi:hypothetical protein